MFPRQPRKEPTQKPYLVFQPQTYKAMQKGIDLLVNAIQPTLGPKPRLVAVERSMRHDSPELLDDGGTIARRVIRLQDKDADMGAMFLRQVLWRVHEKIGDGAATTAVLFKSVFDQGVYYVTSGVNAMRLRKFLEEGEFLILKELEGMRVQVEGKEALAKLAEAICYDPPMARLLGEIIDITGEYGLVEVRKSHTSQYEREYVEGMYWNNGVASRDMITDPVTHMVEMENVSIFISDLAMVEPQALIPLLDAALQNSIGNLLLIGTEYSGSVLGLIFAANKHPEKLKVIAVKTPGLTTTDQADAMQDMAVLTGGIPRFKAASDTLEKASLADFGHARKARAGYEFFSFIGGKGDARRLRSHIATLQASLKVEEEYNAHKKILERIGKLMGGASTLYVPGSTETEDKAKRELAERTTSTVQAALRDGVVPGGGVALLDCRPMLRKKLHESVDPDERAAYQILIKAMEAPTRALLANAGLDPSEVMAEIRLAGPGFGYDVMEGKIVKMGEAGILDVAAATLGAVRAAISGAALALTTDVLVHRRKLVETTEP
jgi:chaperonin GroEL